MVTDFVNAAREPEGPESKDRISFPGGVSLAGHAGRLFSIGPDYQVAENSSGFDACGCGDLIAVGALAVSENVKPEKRIKDALMAAVRLSDGVRGPFISRFSDVR